MISEERKQKMKEASKRFKERNPNYFKKYAQEYYWKNRKKRLQEKKIQDSEKTTEDYLKKNTRAKELRPLKIQVIKLTNSNFKKEPICTFSFCNNNKDLHFHHWRYRLPVQRKDFSTLCRDCHNLVHMKKSNFVFLSKIRGAGE